MQLFSADAKKIQTQIKMFFCPQKVEKTTPKSCIHMAVRRVFFFSADSPQQPKTSYPFYKFFYPIISAKVSESYVSKLLLSTLYTLKCNLIRIFGHKCELLHLVWKISELSKTAICFDANFGAISLVNSTSPGSARSKTSTNLPRVLYVG